MAFEKEAFARRQVEAQGHFRQELLAALLRFFLEKKGELGYCLVEPVTGLADGDIVLDEVPVQADLAVPFRVLAELSAHEEQLLARMGPVVKEKQAQIGEFCQLSPGILLSSEPLPWTTSSWERGRMKFSLKA
jgi:hypothetical protein